MLVYSTRLIVPKITTFSSWQKLDIVVKYHVMNMIFPNSVDLEIPAREAFVHKAKLDKHAARSEVARHHISLDPVQLQLVECECDCAAQPLGHQALVDLTLVELVAEVARLKR